MDEEKLTRLIALCREGGVRRLRTADVELQLWPKSPEYELEKPDGDPLDEDDYTDQEREQDRQHYFAAGVMPPTLKRREDESAPD